jgi:hypothetical protein
MATKKNVFKLNIDTGTPFEFQLPDDDTVYTLPSMRALSGDQVIALSSLDDGASPVEQMNNLYDVLDELCEGLGTAARKYPYVAFYEAFINAWQEHSDINLGELQASSAS